MKKAVLVLAICLLMGGCAHCADTRDMQDYPDKMKVNSGCPTGYSIPYSTRVKQAHKYNPKEVKKAIFQGLTIMLDPTGLSAIREYGKLMKEDLTY